MKEYLLGKKKRKTEGGGREKNIFVDYFLNEEGEECVSRSRIFVLLGNRNWMKQFNRPIRRNLQKCNWNSVALRHYVQRFCSLHYRLFCPPILITRAGHVLFFESVKRGFSRSKYIEEILLFLFRGRCTTRNSSYCGRSCSSVADLQRDKRCTKFGQIPSKRKRQSKPIHVGFSLKTANQTSLQLSTKTSVN